MASNMNGRWVTALILTLLLGACNFSPCTAEDLRAILSDPSNDWAPSTTISFPDGPRDFENATLRWTIYAPPTYSAAISPGTEAEVAKSVKVATSHEIPFLATGGRHGYTTTFAKLQNGLAIDLSKLDSVEVDAYAGTVTVGGGVRVGQIFNPVFDAGFELQTITSQCPGMLGSTLGAGVGRDGGRYGLEIDALVSVRLVTAAAQLIEVSDSSHPDLFWAIRGAGANFGIVTSATYKLHRIGDQEGYDGHVTNADFIFAPDTSAAYFDAIVNSYNGSLPSKLSGESIMMYNATSDTLQIIANWVYFGPEAEAREILAPILDLPSVTAAVSSVPWNKLADTALFGTDPANCPGNRTQSIYGVNMRAMSASTYQAAVEKLVQLYRDHPESRQAMLSLEMFPNQAARLVPDEATAYPWRDTVAHLLVLLISAGEAGEELGRQLREDFVTTSGYPELAVYVNYARGDESLEQIYGQGNFPRLAALKKEWDPSGVFSFNNGLPTEYP